MDSNEILTIETTAERLPNYNSYNSDTNIIARNKELLLNLVKYVKSDSDILQTSHSELSTISDCVQIRSNM